MDNSKCEPTGEIFLGYRFDELLIPFIAGTPIKRKPWGGYWKYSHDGITIYPKDGGEVIKFSEVSDQLFTISHFFMSDWEIATNENCDIEVK